MNPRGLWAVLRFECRRAFAPPRLLLGTAMALFPAFLVTLVQIKGGHLETEVGGFWLFILIPEVLCVLGLLLWATPAVHSELEGKTWTYLAVRPVGKGSILLGKYLAAVVWTALTAWLSVAVCVLIVRPEAGIVRMAGVLAAIVALSCFTYGAIFMMLGVMFLRRGMVVAVAYAFVCEFALAFVPAMISQLTVEYHLRCLLGKWLSLGSPQAPPFVYTIFSAVGAIPTWRHLTVIAALAGWSLAVAIWLLRHRELISPEEA